jgi:hypothetical protein
VPFCNNYPVLHTLLQFPSRPHPSGLYCRSREAKFFGCAVDAAVMRQVVLDDAPEGSWKGPHGLPQETLTRSEEMRIASGLGGLCDWNGSGEDLSNAAISAKYSTRLLSARLLIMWTSFSTIRVIQVENRESPRNLGSDFQAFKSAS